MSGEQWKVLLDIAFTLFAAWCIWSALTTLKEIEDRQKKFDMRLEQTHELTRRILRNQVYQRVPAFGMTTAVDNWGATTARIMDRETGHQLWPTDSPPTSTTSLEAADRSVNEPFSERFERIHRE